MNSLQVLVIYKCVLKRFAQMDPVKHNESAFRNKTQSTRNKTFSASKEKLLHIFTFF